MIARLVTADGWQGDPAHERTNSFVSTVL